MFDLNSAEPPNRIVFASYAPVPLIALFAIITLCINGNGALGRRASFHAPPLITASGGADGALRHQIGQVPDLVRASSFLGPLPQNETVSLTMAFRVKDQEGLMQSISGMYDPASPSFHHWLTPEAFGQRFGRSDAQVRQAADWITSKEFQIDQIWPNNLAITFTGTVRRVEDAFQISMGLYSDGDSRVFYSNQQDPQLPSDVGRFTEELIGLNNAYRHDVSDKWDSRPIRSKAAKGKAGSTGQSAASPAAAFTDGTVFLSPSELRRLYDVAPLTSGGIQGQGQRVAIIIDSDIDDSDIALFRREFSLPAANVKRFVAPGSQNPGIAEHAIETSIDVCQISAVAPLAEIDLVLTQDLSTSSLLQAQEFIVNTVRPASVNESFGGCESLTFSRSESDLMMQAMTAGIAFFAISGDDGAECVTRSASGQKIESAKSEVECPACYEGVTAVGGTAFGGATFDSGGNLGAVATESVWNHPPGVRYGCEGRKALPTHKGLGASGGGMSRIVSKPDYQFTATGFRGGVPGGPGRFVPDVAALASGDEPSSAAAFMGDIVLVFGTSKACPLWAGLMALINQAKGSPQGSPNMELYRLGIQQYRDNGPLVFIDITQGDNSTGPRKPCAPDGVVGYAAGFGYDQVTGWGSPDFARLVAAYNMPGAIGTGPVINSVTARLDGDVLTVNGTATDTAAAMTSVRLTLLDRSTAGVFQTGLPITVRPAASTSYLFQMGGMDKFPSAVSASVVILDRLGNSSIPIEADLSNADPGGPILNAVSFDGRKLAIQGVALNGKVTLEINGVAVGKRDVTSKTLAIFKGSQATLNLTPGNNRIRVEKDLSFSNILLLTL